MGQTTSQVVPGDDFFGTGDYRLEGNMLVFISGDDEGYYHILELTENKLVIKFDVVEETNQNGFIVDVTINGFMTLTR